MKNRDEFSSRVLDIFQSLDLSKQLKKEEDPIYDIEVDSIYRIFHRSNKISYRFKDMAIKEFSESLLPLVDLSCDYGLVLNFIEYFSFDDVLIKAVKNLGDEEMLRKLGPEKCGIILAGSYLIVSQVAKSIDSFFSDIKNKRGFLFSNKKILSPKEALFLESWEIFGYKLRYSQEEDFLRR